MIFWQMGFRDDSAGKELACSAEDAGDVSSISLSVRSPGEGNGNPLQYSCLKNPMDRGAWWATVLNLAELDMTKHSTTLQLHHIFHELVNYGKWYETERERCCSLYCKTAY